MYVSYLLEKDNAMYSSPVRHPGLSHQNFVQSQGSPVQYADYGGYHHPAVHPDSGLLHGGHGQSHWTVAQSAYGGTSREDTWISYPPGSLHAPQSAAALGAPSPVEHIAYSPPLQTDYNPHPGGHTAHAPAPGGYLSPLNGLSNGAAQASPDNGRRSPFDWMRRNPTPIQSNNTVGKTRTKEKYRVVYTDHQRLELEKEFHYSRYITIRRKAELAALLGLSERQIKIWFQNRRAKERKLTKKKLQQQQQQVTGDVQAPAIQSGGPSGPTGPVPLHSGNLGTVHSVSNGNVI
uniref:homeobox protein CDX-1-like isoform X1 n=1 Tax=Myxine glutinosa TaxID=7769 RepID=UPI0035901610